MSIMADKHIETLLTPIKTRARPGHERSCSLGNLDSPINRVRTPSRYLKTSLSPVKTEAAYGHARRGSTGKLDSPLSGTKILSRYLQNSTSSCHDLCKYGIKHTVEAKARDTFPHMLTPKAVKMQVLVGTSAEGKKLPNSPRPPSDYRMQKPSTPVSIKEEVSSAKEETASLKKVLSPSKKKAASGENATYQKLPSSNSRMQKSSTPVSIKEEVSSVKEETASLEKVLSPSEEKGDTGENATDQKLKPIRSNPRSHPSKESFSTQRNRETRISRGSSAGSDSPRKSKNKGKELRTTKIGEKKASVRPSDSLSPKNSVKMASSTSPKNGNDVINVETKESSKEDVPEKTLYNEDVPEKTLYVIEASPESKTLEPSHNGVQTSKLAPSTEDKTSKQARKSTDGSPSSKKSSFRRIGHESSAKRSHLSSSLSTGKKSLRNKPLGVRSASSSLSFLCPDEPSHSKEVGASVTGNGDQVTNVDMEYKSRPRRGRKATLEFKPSSSRKLKFCRGKVVELHSVDSTPRRLKFRRVRLLGEIQNGKANTRKNSTQGKESDYAEKDLQRSIRTRRRSVRKDTGQVENGDTVKGEKVVLKHQNVAGKQKAAQSLYNNVIEETASKLVVTRKSKVKALVGAFETVISLQDTGPSATTIEC